jgi:hypothetical protein
VTRPKAVNESVRSDEASSEQRQQNGPRIAGLTGRAIEGERHYSGRQEYDAEERDWFQKLSGKDCGASTHKEGR